MLFRTRVWLLPISAATVFLIGMTVSYVVGEKAYKVLQHIQESDDPYREQVSAVDNGVDKFRMTLEAAAEESDANHIKLVDPVIASIRSAIDAMTKLDGKAPSAQAIGHDFEAYQQAALAATKTLLGVGAPGVKPATVMASMNQTRKALDATLVRYKVAARQAMVDGQHAAFADLKRNQLINILTGIIVLSVLGLSSKLVLKSVWRDLGDEPAYLRSKVQRVAEGDLVVDSGEHVGDQDSLNAAVASMATKLSATIESIRTATNAITHASKEIAQGNLDLSRRTEQTASNLQHTSSSMSMLTDAVQQSADAAQQAQSMVTSTSQAAERGGAIVSQVINNMDGISQASKKIGEITSVIDGIAFQTNILALNAAVEAARAGEQGRGFAVVAAEVRSLAMRSAEAAREIKSLTSASAEQVDSGTQLVREAGDAMGVIVSGVKRVTDIIGEISTSTLNQSGSIGQVGQSVIELDQMTQQNAALVEQSAAAAEHLRQQAEELMQAVSAFRTT